MRTDDDDLLIGLRQGTHDAFSGIYKRYFMSLLWEVNSYIYDQMAAEDIVTEAFIKLFAKHTEFESLGHVYKFLTVVVRNDSLSYLERLQVRTKAHDEIMVRLRADEQTIDTEQGKVELEVLQRIYQQMEKLPPRCKLVFELAYIKGLSNKEIARQLKLSISAVKNQKSQAIKLLRLKVINGRLTIALLIFWITVK